MAASWNDPRVDDLCRLGEAAASRKGHTLGDWAQDQGDDSGLTATCVRCGRIAYVRLGSGMTGMAGPAFAEACTPASQPVGA